MTKKIDKWPKTYSEPKGQLTQWVVPASWLIEQATRHLKNSEHTVVFASDGKRLWIHGYKMPHPGGKRARREEQPHPLPTWSYPAGGILWGGGDGDEEVWYEDWPNP